MDELVFTRCKDCSVPPCPLFTFRTQSLKRPAVLLRAGALGQNIGVVKKPWTNRARAGSLTDVQ